MKKSLGAKTIVYPTPLFIIGTYDKKNKPNMAAVAWGGICNSEPPCIAISLRKARYSYENIMENKAFTVNIPSKQYIKEADYSGIYSGRNEDKFAHTGLTAVKCDYVNAPYIQEFPLILECELKQSIELDTHTQFIGEIKDVKIDENMITEDNIPDIKKMEPLLYAPGSNAYYGFGELVAKAFSIGKNK